MNQVKYSGGFTSYCFSFEQLSVKLVRCKFHTEIYPILTTLPQCLFVRGSLFSHFLEKALVVGLMLFVCHLDIL